MIYVGVDVGSVSVKVAAVGAPEDRCALEQGCQRNEGFFMLDGGGGERPILLSRYLRILGEPGQATYYLLRDLVGCLPPGGIGGVRTTGAGGQSVAAALGVRFENEFRAVARGVGALHPEARTVFEMGGNSSKYIRVELDDEGRAGISDYEKNGDCAAGTGAFMDQQASRLRYAVEEVGDLVLSVEAGATIAGRCSVFAKTDMIHAQQKGYTPPQILKGLCEAVVRNFKGTVTKGKEVVPAVVLVGGVAANRGIAQAVREAFKLREEELIVPAAYAWMGAVGAGLYEAEASGEAASFDAGERLKALRQAVQKASDAFPSCPPLSTEKVVLLRDRVRPYSFEGRSLPVEAYLGIDVGSVSTNLVALDGEGDLIHEIYLRTDSRPIQVVGAGLREIEEVVGDRIRIRGVGTTGSGRELIGELTGADTVNDEITAHKTGATYVARKLLSSQVDTIFEIGGQDAKFIRVEDGVVVDFTMNEACAAGTGSFLEEQAERLGIRIEEEFAALALRSKRPIRLGERCTVFMERDLIPYLQRGADRGDLAAGLAYSIALNYLNRVVRGRKIGDAIFFQGGTAYNDAVAAAFATLLDKPIVVPPHNGVIGAVGAALLARERMARTGQETRFRGYRIESVDYTLREFTCRACSNFCAMQEFRVEGERTYWGDKCSDQFRKRPKVDRRPVLPDLVAFREEALLEGHPGPGGGLRVGLARSMYFYEQFPFWRAYLEGVGCEVVVSGPTNRKVVAEGIEAAVAEPCFPIQVAHGHVQDLVEKGVDCILQPNAVDAPTPFPETASHLCPWGQTLPFVLASASSLADVRDRILMPTVHFRDGIGRVQRELRGVARRLGASRRQSDRAVAQAYEAQGRFASRLIEAGREALRTLDRAGEMGIILVGRPYTLYDRGGNLNIPGKLRDAYGVNVIPMDFLDIDGVDIRDLHANMFWNYGRKILQAARIAEARSNLHIIYMTNFKCGPDSYVKHYVGRASGKPFLTLQLDGHSNDAGAMTRCEAYLYSKGFLRWQAQRIA